MKALIATNKGGSRTPKTKGDSSLERVSKNLVFDFNNESSSIFHSIPKNPVLASVLQSTKQDLTFEKFQEIQDKLI